MPKGTGAGNCTVVFLTFSKMGNFDWYFSDLFEKKTLNWRESDILQFQMC